LQPFQGKDAPLNPSQFAQRQRQAVLAGIGSQLSQDEGSCHRPFVDGTGQTQQIIPVALNLPHVDHPAQQGCQVGEGLRFAKMEDEVLAQVANAWRELETQQPRNAKNLIREAPSISRESRYSGCLLRKKKAAGVKKKQEVLVSLAGYGTQIFDQKNAYLCSVKKEKLSVILCLNLARMDWLTTFGVQLCHLGCMLSRLTPSHCLL